MGTKFVCDVEGCDQTAPGDMYFHEGVPEGWTLVTVLNRPKELDDDDDDDIPMEGLPPMRRRPPGYRPRVRRLRYEARLLVCSKHELPKFKDSALSAQSDDEKYGLLA